MTRTVAKDGASTCDENADNHSFAYCSYQNRHTSIDFEALVPHCQVDRMSRAPPHFTGSFSRYELVPEHLSICIIVSKRLDEDYVSPRFDMSSITSFWPAGRSPDCDSERSIKNGNHSPLCNSSSVTSIIKTYLLSRCT